MLSKELSHPNIVEFKHNDRTMPGGLFYTLMELLEGDNLHNYISGDLRLPIDEIYKMTTQILSALVYMQKKDPQYTIEILSQATLCGINASCTSL
mgnify:CR=1 FL=1